ncbi:hypothetical protein PHYSODRAFT_257898 [Phytophthora sojae]|uniref:Uncharacterized protein n=1 Tax=Phytophthora sojae (strain P6497) TaxID=1094619 RepID=G4YNX9_PHYSP|nr:hypothetical protein PHYSODRAFT_257898 [Phytophthora sojae]EGZ30686.1 hypothetical protein PHYSODRAFT_257898 [Phytophthora sojae]|eukprot:XP_009517961.1 hypothetical protein PHYSODRAFT_257898 [Phytophthora sojae]
MCLANAVNCLLWVVLCLLAPDKFVMILNAAGAALGIMQMMLCFIYHPKKSRAEQAVGVEVEDLELQAASPQQQSQNHDKLGQDFVALHSPKIQTATTDST